MSWFRERRRRNLREAPVPHEWQDIVARNVPHCRYLDALEQEVLWGDIQIFLAEKYWEGCGGLTLSDEIRITVAAQACLLTLCLPEKFYPNVRTILVYPAAYRVRTRRVGPAGVVTEGRSNRVGEAWQHGSVVLSWQDARAGAANPRDGENLVFHEFAHQLDMLDGTPDGTPPLPDQETYRRWYEVMRDEYDHLVRAVQHGTRTLLDPYGTQDAAELFAVATEVFFERPRALRKRHPPLFELLRDYYRQDPAQRVDRHPAGEVEEDEADAHHRMEGM